MFVLSKISDLIRIDPQNFAAPLAEALEDEINKKYANRVRNNGVVQKNSTCSINGKEKRKKISNSDGRGFCVPLGYTQSWTVYMSL